MSHIIKTSMLLSLSVQMKKFRICQMGFLFPTKRKVLKVPILYHPLTVLSITTTKMNDFDGPQVIESGIEVCSK